MIKVSFLSVFAFDANVSLINELKEKCEISFFTEALHKVYNFLDVEALDEFINRGDYVEQIQRFSELLTLDQTYVIKGTRNKNLVKKLYNSYKIDCFLKKINPDIVLFDNTTLTYLFSAIRLRKKGILIVHDPFQHSGEAFFIDKILRKFFFKLIPSKILLNESQKDRFVKKYKQDESALFTSHLSVYEYLKYYLPKGKVDLSAKDVVTDEFCILFFGRISPYKGIKFLLDTFVKMLDSGKFKKLKLIIAGSGDFDFDINFYNQFPEIVFINKFVPQVELTNLIEKATVVVCPYTDATQSGVIMSAFAFKKPVIATNVGGLPEMIDHLETGVIIEKNNETELYNAISILYHKPQLLSVMKENIEKRYFYGDKSWKYSGERFFEAIKSIHKRNVSN